MCVCVNVTTLVSPLIELPVRARKQRAAALRSAAPGAPAGGGGVGSGGRRCLPRLRGAGRGGPHLAATARRRRRSIPIPVPIPIPIPTPVPVPLPLPSAPRTGAQRSAAHLRVSVASLRGRGLGCGDAGSSLRKCPASWVVLCC